MKQETIAAMETTLSERTEAEVTALYDTVSEALGERLVKALTRLARLYEDLFTACSEEKEGMITLDIDKVRRSLQSQEFILDHIKKADKVRANAMESIAGEPCVKIVGDVTVSKLLPFLPAAQQGEIYALRKNLKDLGERLTKINHINKALCKQSLELTEQYLSIFTGKKAIPPAMTYSARGHEKAIGKRTIVDQQG
ncbi:MAG: flagellar protein FlgN [Planctomycetes bacterium]|nr:flagellar protein FlgN [Planctomycetota bacterium]